MAKIHQKLQDLFKFRVLSNGDIPSYLNRMSRMGKIDEVKKVAMFNIILTKLGEMEDRENVPSVPVVKVPFAEVMPDVEKSYKCDICGKSCASDFGLKAHKRSHTNKK